MTSFEYKVVPAPRKGQKAPGVKTPEARFAHAMQTLINAEAEEGWEYLRADTLPSEERSGLTSVVTHYRNLLVFRRARPAEAAGAGNSGAATTDAAARAEVSPPVPAPAPVITPPAPAGPQRQDGAGDDADDAVGPPAARRKDDADTEAEGGDTAKDAEAKVTPLRP